MAILGLDNFTARVIKDTDESLQSSVAMVLRTNYEVAEGGSELTLEFYYNGGLGEIQGTRGRARNFDIGWQSVNGEAPVRHPLPTISNITPAQPLAHRPGRFLVDTNNPQSNVNRNRGMYNADADGAFWWGSFDVTMPPDTDITENLNYTGLLELTT